MKQGSGRSKSAVYPVASPALPPTLLVQLEPWSKVFLRNLADLVWPRRPSPLFLSSPPGPFWPDVFVPARLPWRRFLESAFYHVAVVAAVWALSQLLPASPRIALRPMFRTADLYPTSDYLPPLNTGGQHRHLPIKGQPEFSRQPIISVPPEPDNLHQTIVTPPRIKLTQDVPLPNIVAPASSPLPIPPAAVPPAANLKLPSLPTPVVAPPPEVHAAEARRVPVAPRPAIVEPPPSIATAALRKLGDVNIAHTEVIAPAPQLPMAERRTFVSASGPSPGSATEVIPPPPSIESTGASNAGGRLIALSIHPLPPSPTIEVPAGNRRGTFAATPEGKPGALGTPDIAGDPHAIESGSGGGSGNGNGAGSAGSTTDVPPGLFVGAGPNPPDPSGVAGRAPIEGARGGSQISFRNNSRLLADAIPPRVTGIPHQPAVPGNRPSDAEKKVFGIRRFYSMSLNMPNLNSAGGSWVIHFAELKENSGEKGELVAPVATQKVDPAYPAALMRENVEGIVTLYAIIHSDGSVGDVRVLRGVDDRLDTYARTALSQWRFQPATRNGTAVAIEAVVMIPFRAIRRESSF
ncbi:MAG: TonB family protein [Acidobacteriia bacterium]|nr:TonB family protein [Terriglobia bacterium]